MWSFWVLLMRYVPETNNCQFITDVFYSEHFTTYVIEYGNIWQELTSCSLKLNFLVHIFFLSKQTINFAFTKHINHKDKNPSDYPWDFRLLLTLYENHKNVSLFHCKLSVWSNFYWYKKDVSTASQTEWLRKLDILYEDKEIP